MPDRWEIRDSLCQRRGVPGSPDSISGARESKVRTPEDGLDSDSVIAADRKYDDTSTDHGKMHDADVAVESTIWNTTFDSGISVDWSKMKNVGSLRTRDPGDQ